MFTAIGLMLTGIALGFALRSFQWPELLGRAISPTIMLMLFALGVAVGGNETLMTNLPVLGGKALILTVACVAGSLICIVAVRRFFPRALLLAKRAVAWGSPGTVLTEANLQQAAAWSASLHSACDGHASETI